MSRFDIDPRTGSARKVTPRPRVKIRPAAQAPYVVSSPVAIEEDPVVELAIDEDGVVTQVAGPKLDTKELLANFETIVRDALQDLQAQPVVSQYQPVVSLPSAAIEIDESVADVGLDKSGLEAGDHSSGVQKTEVKEDDLAASKSKLASLKKRRPRRKKNATS